MPRKIMSIYKRKGITPGRIGGPRPSTFYQAQCGSKLKNFKTKTAAMKAAKRWKPKK